VYVVTDSGPDHSKRFHAVVVLGHEQVAAGDGSSKKQAEMAAALDAWTQLQQPDPSGSSLSRPPSA
jgi:ribonuclease-3